MKDVMLKVVGEYRFKHLVKSAGWKMASGSVSGRGWFRVDGQRKAVKSL